MFRLIKHGWEKIYVIRYVLILFIVFSSTVGFFSTGLVNGNTSWEHLFSGIYKSISLFLFGGLDAGFPAAGPVWARLLLYCNYFLAPLLTAGFFMQLIYRTIFTHWSPKVRGHFIICGLGRNGALIYEMLKSSQRTIVLIEKDPSNRHGTEIAKNSKVWWIQRSFREKAVLERAQLRQAKRVYLTTNNDMVNLNAMLEMKQMLDGKNSQVEFYCQIGDHDLLHNMKTILLPQNELGHIHFFNTYHMVTHRLYHNYLKGEKLFSDDGNLFVLLGFGRFGQLLYHHLIEHTDRSGQDEIFVATYKESPMLDRLRYRWSNDLDPAHCKIYEPAYGDVSSPAVWDQAAKLARKCKKPVIVFIGMDDDIANINTAISMKQHGPEALKQATIICRIYSPAAKMLQEILEKRLTPSLQRDVILFPVKTELQQALREEFFFRVIGRA